ncbi:YbaY family lipoprotein [Aestuariirhabdus litorea]|uniref:META domain-containing protein n=1 Tax=Aestuariirhabdus litorea TaxID=2528527 RepID=A0A3P3VP11_9GAMM|nr:YbaY family lipoprotein [Aestuariirhabdus litorea]RRJ84087.1 META domain-containing protein [Aestuariirhabdus litorea]RWW97307.1 META domain-containing protein [Endozoicomonadaceae bacterium GTF-13]
MNPRQRLWTPLLALIGLTLGGCQALMPDSREQIDTLVSYRERMMLPPEAEVTVLLQDVSRVDAPADIVDEARLVVGAKAPPYALSVRYAPEQIVTGHRYAIRAEIHSAGKLMFTSTEHIDPFAAGAERPLPLMVRRVGGHNPARNTVSLTNTYWKLVRLDDQAVDEGWVGKELFLRFDVEGGHAGGYGGCNQFNASYRQQGNDLSFGPLISTQRACATGMEQEDRFLNRLASVVGFSLKGGILALLNAERKVVAVFEARPEP